MLTGLVAWFDCKYDKDFDWLYLGTVVLDYVLISKILALFGG